MIPAAPGRPGLLRGRRAEVEVSGASDGVCAGKLANDGDLPAAHDPIARLHPEVSQ